jgi:drug/metabolite transporter (DMT)-like permease
MIQVISYSLLAALGWGISPFFDKKSILACNDLQAVFLMKFAWLSFFILLGGLFYNKNRINMNNIKKASKPVFFASLALFVGHYSFIKALDYSTNTTMVVLISYVLPLIIIAILSYLFLNETINMGMLFGMIVTILGIVIFVYYKD